MGLLRLILNVIWLVLCGWWMAILYFLAGLIAFILIITIPFGVAAWRIGGYVLWPFGRQIERRGDAGIGSLIGNIIWIILLGWELALGHLIGFVVTTRCILVRKGQHHALIEELAERFFSRDHTDVVQHLVPEAGVQQMQHRLLGTADIDVHRHPVLLGFRANKLAIVVRVQEAQEVPARAGPLRHRVRLALGRAVAQRTCRIDPIGCFRQGRLSVARRRVILHLRQF